MTYSIGISLITVVFISFKTFVKTLLVGRWWFNGEYNGVSFKWYLKQSYYLSIFDSTYD